MTAALLLLACLCVPQDAPPEPEAPAAGLRDRAVAELEAALDAPLAEENGLQDLRPGDTLAEAVENLLPGHVVRPDTPRLDLEGIDLRDLPLENPPRLPAGRFSVRTAFEELLESVTDVPLTLINDGGILKITTQDYAEERLLTRTYAVRDLLEAAGPSAAARRLPNFNDPRLRPGGNCFGPPYDPVAEATDVADVWRADDGNPPATPLETALIAEQPLIDLIFATTGGLREGGGWEEIDGEGGSLEFFNGLLTVRQTEPVHRQIAHLLADLRAADAAQPWTVPLTLPDPGAAPAQEPNE
ncbi:hypothetical protein [Alienimonas californiensis]|uniref:Uncharacterized protein n=1 Tax=Alienimonas californiensis TaxID=2527989 RepID=A0A517P825_9PLAN|nr:hypothetical protein [Alienimonas californiensis]QDT15529.1 hypothetical protein CA12_16140 [Alienimonas californiensis]